MSLRELSLNLIRIVDEDIKRLEDSMARLDEAEMSEVDSRFYQQLLNRLVTLREKRDALVREKEGK